MSSKILLLENVHESAKRFLKTQDYSLSEASESFEEQRLIKALKENKVEALGIRSKTHVTKAVVEAAPDLRLVSAFCIGTNQIDLEACTKKGIPVFNAPYSNTRSVAELVLCEIIALSRKLSHVSALLHQGVWQKKSVGSFEVRNKSLGIVGYGHIGTQVGLLAESLGMKVFYYDISSKLPLGTATACESLSELLKKSDFVSLHVPETPETKNMMDAKTLELMKTGGYLVNASRGSVVDLKALSEALKTKKIAGAAIDVYPEEPRKNGEGFESVLLGLENVILTPHIGGSTEEAQKAIGEEVSLSLHKYFSLGDSLGAVNFPRLRAPNIKEKHNRICHVHKNKPGVLGEVNSLLSSLNINISYQSLATNQDLGYLILDFEDTGHKKEELLKTLLLKDFTLKSWII